MQQSLTMLLQSFGHTDFTILPVDKNHSFLHITLSTLLKTTHFFFSVVSR